MLEARLAPLLAAHALIQKEMQPLLESLKDISISLDERWNTFTLLVEKNILVNENPYGDGYLSETFGYNNVSLYDDFNMDRHETRTMIEIWDRIIDPYYEDTMCAYTDPVKRDQWRERVLASGFSGFENDW